MARRVASAFRDRRTGRFVIPEVYTCRHERGNWYTSVYMTATTVLVTGRTGYVAGWCMVELLRQGHSVRTTVRDHSKGAALRAAIGTQIESGGRLTVVVADLTSEDGWDAAVSGCDYVLHVASPLGGAASEDAAALIAPAREGSIECCKRRLARV